MSLQDAVAYMWGVVDQGNRVDWGEGGFTLDLQQKGRYGQVGRRPARSRRPSPWHQR